MSDFTVIDNDEKSEREFGYYYGSETFEISRDDIQALLDGKELATTINCDEYSIFIQLAKGDKLMKKLFVSVPMNGRTEEAIRHSIEEMHKIAEIAFGEKLEVIDRYFESDDMAVKHWPIYYLGKSIQAMANADYFIGIESWYDEIYPCRGCDTERIVARYYDIPSILINARDYAFFKDMVALRTDECLKCCEQEAKKQ